MATYGTRCAEALVQSARDEQIAKPALILYLPRVILQLLLCILN